MTDLTIRPAGPADAGALGLLIAGFRDHLLATIPTDQEIQRDLARALGDPAVEFSCAWLGDRAVGYTQTRFFTSVWAGGTEAHLDDLFVVPSARRQMVGRSLLRHALERARARGAGRLGLNTNERNVTAHALYRSEGFAPQSHALYPGGREVFWVRAI